MPQVTLPDGSVRSYEQAVSAFEVAKDIGSRLAKSALGCKINGELSDLSTLLSEDCELSIVTAKTRDGEQDPDALYLLRHSTAHVMAEAIQRILPDVQLVYGPPIDNGFYYDISVPDGRPLSTEDFEAIEREMKKIIQENRTFTRYELNGTEGLEKLQAEGSKYKLDNAERALAQDPEAAISFYATGEPGENWEDLCRGPHIPSTGKIGAFKVMSLAASYWKGDENSDRLTRVYGTAFSSNKELKQYLHQLEEAKKRDHRVLGKQLQLYHIDEAVGQGLILWTPKGSVVRNELQKFISEELTRQGYDQVYTPHIGKLDLYRTSGHFPYYQESQFPPLVTRETLNQMISEDASCSDLMHRLSAVGEAALEGYMLKPMNCPHHIKIYDSQHRSYRDLPVRLAEFGTVYRWEQSGEIGGMTRVRGFTQDDAHIFCTEDQLAEEMQGCLKIVKLIFATLGIQDYRVRVGLRDPDSNKYTGEPENWDRAEDACRQAAATLGVPFSEEAGEAAFYGPKIDFVVKDVIGREWQLGTVQVDYNLPERFNLSYIGADGERHQPVMVHRAPFGSMERFVGVLIEHFAGAFPTWLAPEQVRVLPISEKSDAYAEEVTQQLKDAGIRTTVDLSGERIQRKIRNGAGMKVPYMLIVGPRDAENRQVSVRAHGFKKDLGALPLDTFVETVRAEASTRGKESILNLFDAETLENKR